MHTDRGKLFDILYGKGNLTKHWYKNSILHLLESAELDSSFDVAYYIDCGDDDSLLHGNNIAHELLKEKGIKLFIATGRGKDGLDVLNDFPFDGYITLNGQYCYTNNQIIYSNTIKKEDLQALLDYLKDHQVPCGFTEENTKYFNYRDERVDAIHAITHNDDHPAGDCSHVIDKSIYQIMCFVDKNEEKEILSHMPHCISARWHPTFCDISPIGGTKQLGIDKFLEYYGLDLKDTMAFGDGGNDMQMLQHVSLAVAMGNAGDELKSIADFVTKDVDDEGIAYALKHYGLIDL